MSELDKDSSSNVSSASDHISYNGFDEKADKRIRQLAQQLTRTSTNLDTQDVNGNNNNDVQSTVSRSIFSDSLLKEGVNPVFTDINDPNYNEKLDPNSDNFSSYDWVKNISNLANADPDYYKPYKLGCSWKNLTAEGNSSDVSYQSTVLNLPLKLATLGYYLLSSGANKKVQILKSVDGLIKPGELLVVLGRPGSGCTTLLKSITSNTHGFQLTDESEISYDGLTPKEIKKHYRGDVVYNAEADIHLPHLTVFQTLVTVAKLKTPQNRFKGVTREQFADHVTDVTMATYGLLHTRNTKVGNDLVRGVSGGERKRVSIAEVTICGSKFQCWDNATRGLDSATALEFIRALKTQAVLQNTAATVAIYQCSQDAYDLFDKVCVLDEGYQLFYGSSSKAKEFFIKMGYICPPRQTTADFLTSVTSPVERILNEEYLAKGIKIPQTPRDMSEYWRNSQEYRDLIREIDEYNAQNNDESKQIMHDAHVATQSRRARPSSPYTVSYGLQIKYILTRNIWRMKNSFEITGFQVFGNSAMALILGSMFYKVMLHPTTDTFYYRGAAMFFAVLFNAFSSLIEIFTLYEARPITEKHKSYSLYHPSADAFASIISEIPPKLITSVCFNIIFYFLCNFRRNGGVFFFYYLISIVAVFAMSHLFRCVGSLTKTLQEAMVPASMLLLALSMYTGFAIPRTKILGWSIWVWYINPLAYLFESLMINEFHGRHFPCTAYIPAGGSYDSQTGTTRICSVNGAIAGQDYVLGDDYIKSSYAYEHKHKWRGFGVGMAYVVFFFVVYLVICEYNEGAKQKGEILVFPRSVVKKMKKAKTLNDSSSNVSDVEKATSESISDKKLLEESSGSFDDSSEREHFNISKSSAVFHWRNLCYDVQIKSETRRILNNVDGWVKPGTLTALMGSSGAGKTTLLDCLAERVTMGVITGDIFVDGLPRDTSFPRSIGYCQQQDLHLTTATVRESLRFSAELRQPADVSVSEKHAYVEEVIKILEMEKYADAVVGVAGEGLNVEQRKRLTIGVELAAKPKLLVFLDEPTSGLDSQTAWSICQLMKKLAKFGQAILCTIHQPSAILMQEFDRLLFLQKGGKTVYFGELGDNCTTMIDYFERNGAHKCPPDANPAEWMLEVVGAAPGSHASQDYNEVWRNSDEYRAVQEELDWMESELPKQATETSAHELLEFASSLWIQYVAVCIRLFQQYWRTPSYIWSKFLVTIFNALFIGFTFFKADRTLQGLQNQMLAIFMFTVITNPILQQYLPSFVTQRDLYEARERPSRTFSWKAFIAAQISVEIPWSILAGTLYFLIYYYAIGFYNNASAADQLHERGALFWLFSCAFFVYIVSLGTLVIAFNQVAETAAHLASLMFTMCLSFNGVLVTSAKMPRFWIFMYRVSPFTYFVDALLSTGVANVEVHCADYELRKFTPPSGLTCGEYMDPYISAAGTGYLTDPNNTETCSFCQISDTNTFLASVGSSYHRRWRNFGIFICFIAINYIGGIFFYWLSRVPKGSKKMKSK
ncbi:hypothetical protein TPHA_0D04700 [Tetrapisispora phaffii CBS 4417]|uniref:ABC transporter domain-containing protein n=1 Tax=Tetrapisispora phaffii (strain ATCC 24235 / CBS 4417 / NBRC 1672 / NRRL Y-8282 / UCD 70-5) TaxID=1071381 RepID=G8BS28_TETPH|nr:hypothetical protein TPHA_0D04700 [Tetrapisispora phaffii CBS 4417]CCE63103.1 hypothetical protein TPHA_0D04700 [Tetrapisispora phaffii CBS 4417]